MKREKFITTKAAHTNPNPQSKEQEHVLENPYVAVEALECSLTSPDGTGASVPAKRSIDVSSLSLTYTRSDVLGQYTKYKGKQAPELRDADSLKDMENLSGGKCEDFLFHTLTAEICSENFQNSSRKWSSGKRMATKLTPTTGSRYGSPDFDEHSMLKNCSCIPWTGRKWRSLELSHG